MTNDLADNGQSELFRDGVHLATYHEAEELLEKAAYYLKHQAIRERVAAAGLAEAAAKHTYRDRMQTVLERVGRRSVRKEPMQTPPASEPKFDRFGYYDFVRPEVLALVPESATRVLDVGCGAGRLGEALKARRSAQVVGIEFVPEAARASPRPVGPGLRRRRREDRTAVRETAASTASSAPT